MENRPIQRANSGYAQPPRITVQLNVIAANDKKTSEEAVKPAVFAKSLLDSSFAHIEGRPGY